MIKPLLLALVTLALTPLAAQAQDNVEYIEGTHYALIEPAMRTVNPDKIEVMEFFWHGCVHCYNMEPMIQSWKKQQADDVDFRPSPAVWNKPMELHAKAYYAAEALGVLPQIHTAMFTAMNVDRQRLGSEAEIRELFEDNGVSEEDFDRAYDSFGVGSQARQAASRARAAKITGTPELMVAGKYRVSGQLAGSQVDMLKVADYLVAKERAARGGE